MPATCCHPTVERTVRFLAVLGLIWLLTAIGAASLLGAEPVVRYDSHCLTVNGRDQFVRSAAFHYFRTPRELWRDRFQKIKDAGFNTVETYVPWNLHERTMPAGLDDFSHMEFSECDAWLKMAQEEFGFQTIIRPGPFICAEWAGGGYPRWLAKFAPSEGKDYWLRGTDDADIAWSVHWYDGVCRWLASQQITRKAPGSPGVILVQIENEYDAFKAPNKAKLLRALYEAVRRAGVDVPVFTCLTSECRGSSDPVLSQVFDSDNYYVGLNAAASCARRMMNLRAKQPTAPGFVTELQGGWFSLVGDRLSEDNYSDERHYQAISLMSILGGATGLNTYMFVGGTHFGGWGARGQTTTYDYNAPIREWGTCGTKYAVAVGINQFIRTFEAQLVRSEGGLCELQGGTPDLAGGVRVAPDGTRFVFLHNADARHPAAGTVTLNPASIPHADGPAYNLDQNGTRVAVVTEFAPRAAVGSMPPFDVSYELEPLGTRVLVIPPNKAPRDGTWYPQLPAQGAALSPLPASIRIPKAWRCNDPLTGNWQQLATGRSLPEIGVDDQRYVLYRSSCTLAAGDIPALSSFLVNSFTRDLVSLQINGRVAPRRYPSDAYAAAATRNKAGSSQRIRLDEFDNRFAVEGLLQPGRNEFILLYENIGFEHGYFPMEELSGIRAAGLSAVETAITMPLTWEVATDLGGVSAGWHLPDAATTDWAAVQLDTAAPLARKGMNLQPKEGQDALCTWYRLEFDLPAGPLAAAVPWRMLIRASGNGYMWLNGHDIGRHWEVGPQREYYLPECWLKFGGRNVLVLGLRQTINGAKVDAAEVSPYPASGGDRKQPVSQPTVREQVGE